MSDRTRWGPLGDRQVALGNPDSLSTHGGFSVCERCLRDSCLLLNREAEEVPPSPVDVSDVLHAAARLGVL